MKNNDNLPTGKSKSSRPEVKFALGFFAGICAAFFPRLIVLLNMSEVSQGIIISDVVVFDLPYIIYALIFSMIVGVVVMILEWNVLTEPGKTFMMALSIPALLSGSFNTNNALDLYKDRQSSLKVEEEIQRETPIPTINVPAQKIEPLAKVDDKKSKNISFYLPTVISEAYAANSFDKKGKFLAFRVKEQLYMIVLDRASDSQNAIERANELRSHISEARAIKVDDNQYFVVLDDIRLPRTEALIKADQLRRQHLNLDLNIELLPIENP